MPGALDRPIAALDWPIAATDRLIGGVVSAGRWLALPVVAALALQWPLRELTALRAALGVGPREANDLGQWCFALLVAVALTAATRAGAHLAPEGPARAYRPAARARLRRAAALLVLGPWALALLVGGWAPARDAALALERFPDTDNAGYFLVKGALLLLAALVLGQALLDAARPRPAPLDGPLAAPARHPPPAKRPPPATGA